MCLVVNLNKRSKHGNWWGIVSEDNTPVYKECMSHAKIADTDMIVYKGLDSNHGQYTSPYKDYPYEVGTEYYQTEEDGRTKFSFTLDEVTIRINRGLHASTTFERALQHGGMTRKAGLFIIPKGSTYFTDGLDIVCDRYIFHSVITKNALNFNNS